MKGRRELFLALALAAVAAAFRLPNLGSPGEEYFDEVYHAKSARQYLQGEPPVEWVHPPTAKLLIAAFVWLFGYEPWAWRLAPALAGVAVAPVFFLLARRVLAAERAALLAAALLLADGVYLVQSRIAMTNIFAVLFQLGSALFVLRAALPERMGGGNMAAAGVFLGLAVSTRWTSLWAWGFLGLVVLAVRGRRLFTVREVALVAMAFVLLPAFVYLDSYIPLMHQWARQGHGGLLEQLPTLVNTQREIWRYHANLEATHPYFSEWYTWPWLYRPTWYYFTNREGLVRGIFAIGNPALWWISVPAAGGALLVGLARRDPRLVFAGAGFCCLYLPWGISPRTLNYGHYLFEAIPYACLALGTALDRLWDGFLRPLARGYVTLVWALFLYFYPILAAVPIPAGWFLGRAGGVGLWTWFATWV
jgi:dolichyl-phosphate-mannose--protein O-mannosyl transferase